MNYIIDIVLVSLVVLIVAVSSKRGLILTIFDFASGIVAFIGARILSPYVSTFVYDNFFKATVVSFLAEKYSAAGDSLASAIDNMASVFSFLPEGIYAYITESGLIDSQSISQSFMTNITTVEQIESSVVGPIMTSVIQLIAFAALSTVLLIVLRIVAKFISRVVNISKIAGKLNSILGAAVGLLKGLVYVFIIAVVICVLSYASETVAVYAADSYICSFASKLIGI